MAFSTKHAKEALPDGSDKELEVWVKTANKALEDGKSDEAAQDLATKVAKNMKESKSFAGILELLLADGDRTDLRADVQLKLAEAGRVLSAANEGKLQSALEAITAVLAALDKGDDKAEEALRKIREAFSQSADDAGYGVGIQQSLLILISREADEPDQVAMLQAAYDALDKWVDAERAEIGVPSEDDDSGDTIPVGFYGWEAYKANRDRQDLVPLVESAPAATTVRASATVPVSESVIRRDGTIRVKLISPGWGTSGYYSQELLETAGPKVFTDGLHMYWDHPTRTEESDRPERSLRDLAAVQVGDSIYDASGPAGPGLYADAKPFDAFRESIEDLASDIGVSIRALGTAHQGEAEGKIGRILDDLVAAESTDFVTVAGRGGEILQLFEAARRGAHPPTPGGSEVDQKEHDRLIEAERTDKARAQEELAQLKADKIVDAALAEADLPQLATERLKEAALKTLPLKDGALDDKQLETDVAESITAEKTYLATVSGNGRVRGMGGGGDSAPDSEAAEAHLEESFKRMGLSEDLAKSAAKGR
ncbi:MAG: hypothetical protein M3O87_08245 [Candidatus Dormibacteraeota bacterium]|nr:hypothetical protein [Candidatus Dormibacteraeota bacterium]